MGTFGLVNVLIRTEPGGGQGTGGTLALASPTDSKLLLSRSVRLLPERVKPQIADQAWICGVVPCKTSLLSCTSLATVTKHVLKCAGTVMNGNACDMTSRQRRSWTTHGSLPLAAHLRH